MKPADCKINSNEVRFERVIAAVIILIHFKILDKKFDFICLFIMA